MTGISKDGWKNYPTWAVNLWLSNDEGYGYICEVVAEIVSETESTSEYWTLAESHKYNLSDRLKAICSELPYNEGGLMPEISGMRSDLLGWAFAQVDWDAIAAHWIADVSE